MRKIILTLLRHSMPGLLLSPTACLNETPHDQIAETEAYTNATDLYLNTIGNLYLQIGSNQESQGLQGTYRDFICTPGHQPTKHCTTLGNIFIRLWGCLIML